MLSLSAPLSCLVHKRDTHTRNRWINTHYAPLIGSQMQEHHKRAGPSACIQWILHTCNICMYIYIFLVFLLHVCGGTGRTIPKWATLFMLQTRALIRAFIRAWTTSSMCRGGRCKGHKNESKKSKETMPAPSHNPCALRLTPVFFLALQ